MRDPTSRDHVDVDVSGDPPYRDIDLETSMTSPADVESAGRSCLVILILAVIILLLLCAWIGLRSTGSVQ